VEPPKEDQKQLDYLSCSKVLKLGIAVKNRLDRMGWGARAITKASSWA